MEQASELIAETQNILVVYGLKIMAAVVIIVIGRIVAGWVRRLVTRIMTHRRTDPIILSFVSSLVYVFLMVVVILAALSQIGVETTSFIAVIGAAGLAIGLALQGSLANFAAGFLLIVFRPFKVGDFIEGAGAIGTVDSIQIFTTTLRSPDNKIIIVPNAKIAGDSIVNHSAMSTRRVDFTIGVSYDADIRHVRNVLHGIIAGDNRIQKEPEPMVVVGEMADNSVNFIVRVWVKAEDYWAVFFDTTETVKLRFDEEKIGIPYPQRDVHLYQRST